MSGNADTIDRVVAYLQKREGIDKTLKLIRYTSRLVAAVSPKDSERQKTFATFEKSVGVSRKAYRVGKFLQGFNALRKSSTTGFPAVLELVASGGDGLYYFLDQFVWLIKAGAIKTDKDGETELGLFAAWAELSGYVCSIWLSIIKLRELRVQELILLGQLTKDTQVPSPSLVADSVTAPSNGNIVPKPEVPAVSLSADATPWTAPVTTEEDSTTSTKKTSKSKAQAAAAAANEAQAASAASKLQAVQSPNAVLLKLRGVQSAQRVRIAAIAADLSDSLLALNDIRGGKDRILGNPAFLAAAGLFSGCISAHKNWYAK
mmetsp:Transcript_7047/g.11996  ORF Transcript_7047/g.11996 Transcript_7047/m.11996 type:complete len:318 (+) Transcript_7047:31-984(+)